MKHMLLALALGLSASLYAWADQNPAPANVGANFSTFTCSASSLLAFPGNKERAYILIQNEDAANTVVVKFGSTITGSEGILLQPKSSFEPHPAINGQVYCKSASGGLLSIVEGLK